jgi:hypothetical protein
MKRNQIMNTNKKIKRQCKIMLKVDLLFNKRCLVMIIKLNFIMIHFFNSNFERII